jgi:hypothetical protein
MARDNVARSRLQWDSPTDLPGESIAIIAQHVADLAEAQWARRPEAPVGPTLHVATDASNNKVAYVVFNPDGTVSTSHAEVIPEHLMNQGIFLKELYAVKRFAEHFSIGQEVPFRSCIMIAVDNTAVCHVLRRGLSKVTTANQMLNQIFGILRHECIQVVSIPSEANAADPLTRDSALNAARNLASWSAITRALSGASRQYMAKPFVADASQQDGFRHTEDEEEELFLEDLVPELDDDRYEELPQSDDDLAREPTRDHDFRPTVPRQKRSRS